MEKVLVTGATGFVGAHVVDHLLKNNYFVRATARSQDKADHILSLYPEYKDKIEFVIVPDLTNENAFAGVLDGIEGIFHIASPVDLAGAKSVDDEIVTPAKNGTLSILSEAFKTPSIKRIVFTSSIICLFDFSKAPGYVYTEKDFNPIEIEEEQKGITNAGIGYAAAKCYSEKIVWDFLKKNKVHFDVVVLCGPLLVGPIIHHIHKLSDLHETGKYLYERLTGKLEIDYFVFDVFMDVRDFAVAQRLSYETPAASNQRLFVANENFTWQEVVDFANKNFPNKFQVKGNPGNYHPPHLKADVSKASKILGIKYRPKFETFYDNIAQLLEFEASGK